MFGVSTAFLFLVIGLVSGQRPAILPSPSLISNATTSTPHINKTTNSTSMMPSTHSTFITPNASTSAGPSNKTTPTPTSTTTPKPTPTPTPTPTPKPTPNPQRGDYSVKDKDGKYCLLAKLAAVFMIQYAEKTGKNTTKNQTATVHMPTNHSLFNVLGSKCGKSPVLKIAWSFYTFTMGFKSIVAKSDSNETTDWQVSELSLVVKTTDNPLFKNATVNNITLHAKSPKELDGLKAGMKGYYMCELNHTYSLGEHNEGQLLLEYVKLQPFGVKANKTEEFGKEFNCVPSTPAPEKSKDNNIVPIAVGCALAGLVLIVLIAYIIGRRKSQRGYEKV